MQEHISLTSRLLDFLGNRLLIPIDSRGLGLSYEARDFYWRPEDRPLVAVKDEEIRKRLRVNQLRIRLLEPTAWVSAGVAFAICLAGMLAVMTVNGVAHVAATITRSSAADVVAREFADGDCKEVFQKYTGKEAQMIKDGVLTVHELNDYRQRCSAELPH